MTGLKAFSFGKIIKKIQDNLSKINSADYEKIADNNRSTKIGLG